MIESVRVDPEAFDLAAYSNRRNCDNNRADNQDIPDTPESFKRYTTSSSPFFYFARQISQNKRISTIAFQFDVLRNIATSRKPMSLGLTDSRRGALPTPRNRAPLSKREAGVT